MKFPQKIMVYLLLFTVQSVTAFAQVIDIPDPNLQRTVRETLNLPAGDPITQADMRQLTSLNAKNATNNRARRPGVCH